MSVHWYITSPFQSTEDEKLLVKCTREEPHLIKLVNNYYNPKLLNKLDNHQ